MIRPTLFALFGLILHGDAAKASLFCLIPETADGFVALRAAPGSQSRLVLGMKAGDEVQIVESGRGSWSKVRYWPGDARLTKGYEGFTEGHVSRRFLRDCG